MSDNTTLVQQFCDAFARRDVEEILGFFTEDAVYHNIPMPAMTGKPAIRTVLDMFLKPAQSAEIELPVMGTFEIKDGKISAWRDYFDMATWTRQTA
jgi:limonene-1,2-epoxide hydrolase